MTTAPTIIGIDLGKNWFHLIGLDERGATVLRQKLIGQLRRSYEVLLAVTGAEHA